MCTDIYVYGEVNDQYTIDSLHKRVLLITSYRILKLYTTLHKSSNSLFGANTLHSRC